MKAMQTTTTFDAAKACIFVFCIVSLLNSLLVSTHLHANSTTQKHEMRIIALAPHLVELLYDLGAENQIIATSTFADYPASAKQILRVGDHSRLQIEKIIQLKPDLIIAWKSGNPLDDLARLESYGIRVEYSDPKVLDDVAHDLRWLGELVGRQNKAESLATDYENHLNRIRDTFSGLSQITTFFEIWPSPLQSVSGQSWPQQQLEVCGAANIIQNKHENYPSISLEQVLTNLPQIIIQPRSIVSPNSAFFDWQAYSFIPAVKHQFILHPDADKMYRMTRRVADEIESMCYQIHKARNFYSKK
jgi:vitamin B12 transport system substrate-binding protein